MKNIKLADIILFITINIMALILIVLPPAFMKNSSKTLEIWQDGEIACWKSLPSNDSIAVDGVIFEIDGDRIKVVFADCPDGLCMKTGQIKNIGESIVCLPNKVIAKITGKSEVDSIAY